MSYKRLQLSPQSSTQVIRPSTPSTGFVQSWFQNSSFENSSQSAESSSNRAESTAPRGINWGAILGLALSLAVSAGFWGGVVWIVARIWK
jgi:hypothetical protein